VAKLGSQSESEGLCTPLRRL